MAKFIATGMRTKIEARGDILIVNTCSSNDSSERGDDERWVWSNPTNRRFPAIHSHDENCQAVSTEALWQGTKAIAGRPCPDPLTLSGDWRRGKAKRPMGAWDGPNRPLLTTPASARRAIYLPAFEAQIRRWLEDPEVQGIVERARKFDVVYLRDFDTGQGVDRNGPMSHAWVLSVFLNTGAFPR